MHVDQKRPSGGPVGLGPHEGSWAASLFITIQGLPSGWVSGQWQPRWAARPLRGQVCRALSLHAVLPAGTLAMILHAHYHGCVYVHIGHGGPAKLLLDLCITQDCDEVCGICSVQFGPWASHGEGNRVVAVRGRGGGSSGRSSGYCCQLACARWGRTWGLGGRLSI